MAAAQFFYYLFLCFARCTLLRMRFLIRKDSGVTSKSSSSAKNSKDSSKLITRGGVKRKASSDPLARVLVSCFFLQTLLPDLPVLENNQQPSLHKQGAGHQ